MEYIADLHIHSKYARATSQRNDLENIATWAKKKGINIIGTGDFTHPKWFNELKKSLLHDEDDGLYRFRDTFFVLTTELSTVYAQGGRLRKVHHGILSPSFDVVEQIIDILKDAGKLDADGRPTLSIHSPELVERLRSVSDLVEIYSAHVWTPWFGVFGSKSGFDTIEECYQDQARYIHALETGLSSDPKMNWRLSALDNYTLISGSDMHSPENIGREATVFEFDSAPSYKKIITALRTQGIKRTIEFYPEEGKYHYDGHRNCNVRLSPAEAKRYGNICPVCKRPLTLGVLHRVDSLADRPEDYIPEDVPPFESLIPLREILSQVLHASKTSRKVVNEYERLVGYFGNEYNVLHAKNESLRTATTQDIAMAIVKARIGDLTINPGYDGVYGKVIINLPGRIKLQKSGLSTKHPTVLRQHGYPQKTLFDY